MIDVTKISDLELAKILADQKDMAINIHNNILGLTNELNARIEKLKKEKENEKASIDTATK